MFTLIWCFTTFIPQAPSPFERPSHPFPLLCISVMCDAVMGLIIYAFITR